MPIKISKEAYEQKFGVPVPTTKTPEKQGFLQGIGNDISSAFKGGISQFNQGKADASKATNPIQMTEAGLKQGAGLVGAALSPLAPATKYIGQGVDYAADKISDIPEVQKFAQTKAGEVTSRVAEDTANTATLLSLKGAPKVAKAGVDVLKKAPGPIAKATDRATGYARSVTQDVIPSSQRFINEEVAKALDLTPGDLANISKSTGNDVGEFLSKNNLIGKNKEETQSNLKTHFDKNYADVRTNIDSVSKTYKQSDVPRYETALQQINKKVAGVPGLESVETEVKGLLGKEDVTLSDVQRVKELLDDHYSLYKVTGDVGEGAAKEGLSNIRSELRKFIEDEVQTNTGQDIRSMNNAVATTKSLGDTITKRDPKGTTRSNLQIGDMATFGLGSMYGGVATGLALVFGKKLLESPTVRLRLARMVDKWSDAKKAQAAKQLQQGVIPKEFAPFIKNKDLVGRTIRQGLQTKPESEQQN